MIRQDSKSIAIAGTAIFSALVAAIEYLSLAIPILRISFLPLPYLKFDLAEIPAALSYFVFGLPVGVTTSLLVPLTIIARGTSNPLGAWIKGLAVLSTIIGFASRFLTSDYPMSERIIISINEIL